MKTFLIAISLFLTNCFSAQHRNITDFCMVGEDKFTLLEENGKSIIEVNSKGKVIKQDLKIVPPCYFIRHEKNIQSVTYKNIQTKVILITGSLLDSKTIIYRGGTEGMICGNKLQGVLIKNNNILITDTLLTGGMYCKDYGLDEKDFYTFAHIN